MIKDVLGRGGVEGGGVVGGGMGTNPDFRNQIASGSNEQAKSQCWVTLNL